MAEHCYRHPGRETAVSCSNCGRPICPDCMTSTPVGMRCPECAGERTQVRQGAAAFGFAGEPRATYALIAANVVFFVASLAGGSSGVGGAGGSVINDFGLFGPAVADGEWYRVVTGGFLHAGLIHIAFNMYALWLLGGLLEPAIGTARFVGIYVVSLFAGALGALLVEPNAITVGASGAVFGLFGAAFVIARGRRLEAVAGQLGLLLLLNLVFTFSIPNISIGGHLGGLAGGGVAGMLVIAGERGMLGDRPRGAELAVLALLAAAAFAASILVA